MCGRYLLRNAPDDTDLTWREYYEGINGWFTVPRFNICPSQECIVLRYINDELVCDTLKWGFKPAWSKYQPLINAKAENLFESKMFKNSILNKRCLIVADGFYEPKGPSSQKSRPWHLFEYEDQRVFSMAGIWVEDGFAILTNEPNAQVVDIHSRMPHIIEGENRASWLNPKLKEEAELRILLEAQEYEGMKNFQVSDYVKKPGKEGPECAEPMEAKSLKEAPKNDEWDF